VCVGSVGLQQGLNAIRTLAIVRSFVDATSACDAIPLTATDAEHVWAAVAEVWNNAGGPILNGDLVQTLYRCEASSTSWQLIVMFGASCMGLQILKFSASNFFFIFTFH
jgi:hypothetical protein